MAKVYRIFGKDLTYEQIRHVDFSKSTLSDLFEVIKVLNPMALLYELKEFSKAICSVEHLEDMEAVIGLTKQCLEAYILHEFPKSLEDN